MDNISAQKQASADSMDVEQRRSSILKQKHRSPLTPVEVEEQADTTLAKQSRRVSFASSNFVKQFVADPEKNTIWDTTYEETLSHTDSSKDTQNSELIAVERTRKEHRQTIYFNETGNDDIEVDEEIFHNLPPELAVDKENLFVRKRSYERDSVKESPMEKRANISDMEFTQVLPKRQEIIRKTSVVLYRNESHSVEEVTMADTVRNETQSTVDMEFTECIPIEKIMLIQNLQEANEDSLEETAVVGGIIKESTNHEKPQKLQHLESSLSANREEQDISIEQEFSKSVPTNENLADHIILTKPVNENIVILSDVQLPISRSPPKMRLDLPVEVEITQTPVFDKSQNIQVDSENLVASTRLTSANGQNANLSTSQNVDSDRSSFQLVNKELTLSNKFTEKPEIILNVTPATQSKNITHSFSGDTANLTNADLICSIKKQMKEVFGGNEHTLKDQCNVSECKSLIENAAPNDMTISSVNNTSAKLLPKSILKTPLKGLVQNAEKSRVQTDNLRSVCSDVQKKLKTPLRLNAEEKIVGDFKDISINKQTETSVNVDKINVSLSNTSHFQSSFIPMETSVRETSFIDPPKFLQSFNTTSNFAINTSEADTASYHPHCASLIPESCSMNLNHSVYTDDTQYLIDYNLSSSKKQPASEYSKIIAGDYNPSPVNSRILALSDMSNATMTNYLLQTDRCHVSLPMNVDDDDDEKNKVLANTNLSQENLSLADSFMYVSSSAQKIVEQMSVTSNEPVGDFGNQVTMRLEETDLVEKRKLDFEEIKEDFSKLRSLNEALRELFKAIHREFLKKNEVVVRYSTDEESSPSQSMVEVTETKESMSILESSIENESLSVVELMKEKANKSIHYWKIKIIENGRCCVSTLYDTIISQIDFDQTTGKIEDISTNVRIKDRSKPISKYVSKQFEKKLSPEMLVSCLGPHFDILSFLDYVQLTFLHFIKILDEYTELAKEFAFELHEDMRVTFTVINIDLMLVWDIEVNFANEVLNEESVKVEARLGAVNEKAVKKCINGCPQGFAAFTPFTSNVKSYMNSLKRNVKN